MHSFCFLVVNDLGLFFNTFFALARFKKKTEKKIESALVFLKSGISLLFSKNYFSRLLMFL